MDATITYDEVATLVAVNIPSLDPSPNFECIHLLCQHFECALQHLPCPQSTLHSWKGMVMAQELYACLMQTAFHLPNNPSNVAIYVRPILAGQAVNSTSLTRTEQAMIDTQFVHKKHYFSGCAILSAHASLHLSQASMTPLRFQMTARSKVGTQECVS